MPFFLTGGVKTVKPSSGRVWRWLAATAAAMKVAAIMVMVFCVGRLCVFLVSEERRGEKPLVELISRQKKIVTPNAPKQHVDYHTRIELHEMNF
jgi:dienelactone hydrolase